MQEASQQINGDIQWPTQLPQLKMLDHHLRCPICYNYFNKPVIATGCAHNFCSFCIRNYISIKNSCPVCSAEVTDRLLKTNRILDEILLAYHPIRKFILAGEDSSNYTSLKVPESPGNGTAPKLPRIETPQKGQTEKNMEKYVVTPSKTDIRTDQPSTSRSQSFVPCPICFENVEESKINMHLDACLKSKKPNDTEEKPPSRKPMPKLIYSIMQEKELRKRLKTLGLSHQGDKKTLINRHKKYTNLYNAECDAANPRPVEELIRELEREEAAEKKFAVGRKQIQQQQPQPERGKLSEEAIDQMNREYLRKHKDHFQKLVDEIKERQKMTAPLQKETNDENEIVVLPQEPKVYEEISLLDEDDLADQSNLSMSNFSSQQEALTPEHALLGTLGYVNTAGQNSPTYSPVPSPTGSSSADQFPDVFGCVNPTQSQSPARNTGRLSRNRRAPSESPSDETNPSRRSTRRKI